MPITVASVETDVRGHFSDITRSMFLSLVNEANFEILEAADIKRTELEELTALAVGGTYPTNWEYALDDDIAEIKQATYFASATNYHVLKQTSIPELDEKDPLWRQRAVGTPQFIYDNGGYVGLVPAPDTATSGGYPKVVLNVLRHETLTILSSLPGPAWAATAWTEIVAFKYAERMNKPELETYGPIAAMAKNRLVRYLQGRMLRAKPKVAFRIPRTRGA